MTKHGHYYIALFLILVSGGVGVLLSSSNRAIEISFVVLTSLSYVFWGILHHALHHDTSAKIVIEYVLMGSLGMAILLFIVKGGI